MMRLLIPSHATGHCKARTHRPFHRGLCSSHSTTLLVLGPEMHPDCQAEVFVNKEFTDNFLKDFFEII